MLASGNRNSGTKYGFDLSSLLSVVLKVQHEDFESSSMNCWVWPRVVLDTTMILVLNREVKIECLL